VTQAEEHEGPVVRDRRRIDPETGQVRENMRTTGSTTGPATEGTPAASPEGSPDTMAKHAKPTDADLAGRGEDEAALALAELQVALTERTDDLKRLQAEYLNYKRRVDRDREAVRDLAVGAALTELLPVVDDIGRAREHGELAGGFKAVAEALESVLTKLGLVRYGEVGEPFDPRIHEALMHSYSDDVDGPTCSAILQPGYRHGERVLRPARVAVAEPTVGLPTPTAGAADAGAGAAPADDGTDAAGEPDAPEPGSPDGHSRGGQPSDEA
jgi:molecular chaperone GrpE